MSSDSESDIATDVNLLKSVHTSQHRGHIVRETGLIY